MPKFKKHGLYKTVEFRLWGGMRYRCKAEEKAHIYRDRGIKVCERWNDFTNFLADMGPRPSSRHSIERLDNSKGYEPSNCVWAMPVQQSNNRRSNHLVVYRGVEMTLADALRAAGNVVPKDTARLRIVRHGWDVARAVETPADARFNKYKAA